MTTLQKAVVGALLVIGAVAIWGAYFYPKVSTLAGSSPAGATFSSAKFAGTVLNLATIGANGTTSSILNTSTNDWYVTGVQIGCENLGRSTLPNTGVGLTSLGFVLGISTTSTATPVLDTNTNYVAGQISIATTSGYFTLASSTLVSATTSVSSGNVSPSGSTLVNYIWPAGSYMTFFSNATNTAQCTVGVNYFSS